MHLFTKPGSEDTASKASPDDDIVIVVSEVFLRHSVIPLYSWITRDLKGLIVKCCIFISSVEHRNDGDKARLVLTIAGDKDCTIPRGTVGGVSLRKPCYIDRTRKMGLPDAFAIQKSKPTGRAQPAAK